LTGEGTLLCTRPDASAGACRGGAIDTDILRLIAVSAVVMGMAHTVSRERIFVPVRERLGGRETWLGYLVSCPYCASHWIAFVLVPLTDTYGLRITYSWGFLATIIDWFLSSILVTIVAAFLRVAFYFVDETQGLVRRQQRKVDVETTIEQRPGDRARP
jgi:hypothetical protein